MEFFNGGQHYFVTKFESNRSEVTVRINVEIEIFYTLIYSS